MTGIVIRWSECLGRFVCLPSGACERAKNAKDSQEGTARAHDRFMCGVREEVVESFKRDLYGRM